MMPRIDRFCLGCAVGLLLALSARPAASAVVGSAFSYQGRLTFNDNQANGFYDFEFLLFDAPTSGTQIGSTQTADDLVVKDGLFNLPLDFGSGAFGGGGRWIEIHVREGVSVGAYTTLLPRQELAPAPYALALPNVYTDEGSNFVGVGRNFRISGNEVFGVRYVGSANQYGGMYVETAHAQGWPFYGYATNGSFRAWSYYDGTTGDWQLYNAGIRLRVPNEGGLWIGPATTTSLLLQNTTGADGIRINDTGDDGIQVGNNPDYPNYALYIPSPGVSTYGLWSNTANASGEWALYTVDKIQAGNVSAASLSVIAKVSGPESLASGDVVAVAGMADALPGGQARLSTVRLADAQSNPGVIGVVERRMVWAVAPGKEDIGEMSLQGRDGPAKPGEYVTLAIYGIAEVKVDPGAEIPVGSRLTLSSQAGRTRALQTTTLNGMVVTEGAPSIGTALESPVAGKDTIAVFVTLR